MYQTSIKKVVFLTFESSYIVKASTSRILAKITFQECSMIKDLFKEDLDLQLPFEFDF